MDENPQNSDTLFPHETGHGHHRSARERQRRGPMWGCLKGIFFLGFGGLLLLILVIAGGWWYVGSSSFADLIARRVAETLKARLGRDVKIGLVVFDRAHLRQVVLKDVEIANAPGAVSPRFATVKEVVITGGVDSFWGRKIKVGRIDVKNPQLFFEIYPAGSKLTHNFPHWNSGPPSKYEIVHLDIGEMFVNGGQFTFLDRRHQITGVANNISSRIQVTRAKDLYAGTMMSPKFTLKIQDYMPIDFDMRGGFRYTPGRLELQSIALRGVGIDAFVSGAIDPLTEGTYNLRIASQAQLQRVREIFRVNRVLDGAISMDTTLRGTQGNFTLTGGWVSPDIVADTYEITNAKGTLNVTGDRTLVDVTTARYGSGTIGAHYILTKYAEPYPMNVDLRFNGVSIEKLFDDWNIQNTGLRGAATGQLSYHWNKDKILEGAGSGTAQLAKNATLFSGAKYPIPIGGSTGFALDNGVITFRSLELATDASQIRAAGTLRISDVYTNLQVQIHSSDFSELDRVGYNFAHSAGKKTYNLLGLGGAGDITGTVRGRLKTPEVVAHISATGTKYNNVLLGASTIDLRYDGTKSLLTFDRAVFVEAGGRLAVTGTVGFPNRGPSPQFDIGVEATNYPIDRAMEAVNLKLNVGGGNGTGKLIVTGTPDAGKVTFLNLVVNQGTSQMRLSGDVNWLPGKGTTKFNLDIAAREFPVKSILTFLDLSTFPVTGNLTGTLHLEGSKSALEGAGSVTVRNGTIYGEPVNVASADITFTRGTMKATNVNVTAPAGEIKGEAELNLTTNQFSYNITSSSIDLSRLQLLQSIKGLLGGNVVLTSTGGGTLDQPELVVEATLNNATLSNLALPAGYPPPSLYIAIRNGRLIVRGSIADVLTIEGDGAVGQDNSVDGSVRINIPDIARLIAISPKTAAIPAAGNAVIDLKLGGRLSPIQALRIDATMPTLNLKISEHEFTPRVPIRFGLREGRIVFDSFELQRTDNVFTVAGFAEIIGQKRLGIDIHGELEAALAQLFVNGLRADGHIALGIAVRGTMTTPALNGTAELQNAQVRFPGFPQLIDNLNGTLVFRGDRIDIDSLSATVGGGRVVAGGFVTVAGLTPSQYRVTLTAQEPVAIRYFEGLTTEGTFALVLSGDMERATLTGDATITRALYSRDFNLQQSIVNLLVSRRGITPIVAASWQDRLLLRLHLVAPNTLAVRNNIADVTGSAELDVNGTLANPVIIGAVTLNEGGIVTFQNVDYRVVRGTISFQNPFRIDPYFDVTVEGRVSGGISEIETGPLDVTVNITGTLDRITPTITSDPPASDITLFSILGFGSLTRTATPATTTTGTPGYQGLVISTIAGALGPRVLPFVDTFSYDPGTLDTSLGAGRKVSFERRVSNNVRVLVVYNLDNAKSREVVEWAATRDWTLQVTDDRSANQYRLDARFRRLYQGRWSLSGHGRGPEIFPVPTLDGAMPNVTAPLPSTTTVASIPNGTVVSDVQFRVDRPFATNTLMSNISIKPGQPLTTREVQSTIKSLFGTGNFRDVRVDATPNTNGAHVTIALYLNYRVGNIVWDGARGAERTRAARELRIHTGDVLSLNAVDQSAVDIQQELNRDGYLEATVDPETTFVSERNLADVTFHINSGPQAKVANVILEGDVAPFTTRELIARMKEQPGKPFRLLTARSDADRMENYLVRRDYRRATVEYVGETYDKATNSTTLRYRATAGPLVKVAITGATRREVRGLLPFARNQQYSEDVIDRAAQDIQTSFQQRGYINAVVDTANQLAGNTLTVTFNVQPGQRYQLRDVTFTGNIKIPDKTLAGLIQTGPSGGIRHLLSTIFRRPTGVTRAQLTADRDTIESYYRLQGFSVATVATPTTTTHPDGTLSVDFPITEGPQTLVSGVMIEGAEQVDSRSLPKMQIKPGDPLNPQLLQADVLALQSFYAERGNAEVGVNRRVVTSDDKTSATVTYSITEGPQIRIGDIIVRGNTYTDRDVILRKAELYRGDPFTYTSILEAQRNLYRLGIFNRVDIQPEQAGTSVSERNIVISVEEGKNLTTSGSTGFLYDVALDKISPRLSGAIAQHNLFGTGRYLGLEGVWAQQTDQELYLTYIEPFIGKANVPVQATLFQTDDLTRKHAHIRQRGLSIEASRVSFLRSRWSLQYQYKISQCVPIAGDLNDLCTQIQKGRPIPTLPPSLLNIQIASVTPTFFWDKRDDIIDPHRGFFTSASLTYAFPLFAANANFTKEYAQGAWYLPLSTRSVFALSGRVGLIQPLGHSEQTRFIPPSERFLGGGETSHRAYGLDLLGDLCVDPREKQRPCTPSLYDLNAPNPGPRLAPLGGNGIFIVNAEYRFPIFSALGGALFTDIGNVFGTSTVHLDDLRYGVGTGLRYISPVGPLRFDVGYKLNRRLIGFDKDGRAVYESPIAFSLSLGYAF